MPSKNLSKSNRIHKSKNQSKEIAKSEVARLFGMAADEQDPKTADGHVHTARKLAMKFQISLTGAQRRQYCHSCYHVLKPGVTCRVRAYKGKQIFYCYKCKSYTRFPYSLKKK